jgi:hypothetical protein
MSPLKFEKKNKLGLPCLMAQIYCFLKGEKEWITQKVKKKLEKTKQRKKQEKKGTHLNPGISFCKPMLNIPPY